jgi:hypothetical protein
MVPLAIAALGCIPPCHNHLDCAHDDVCWESTCIPAFDHEWEVDIVSAEVEQMAPDDRPWDADHTPPDLYTDFGLDGLDACVTSFVPNSFDPVWYEACSFWVPRNPLFYVDLWDVDEPADTFATTWEWDGNDAWVSLARTAGHEMMYIDPTGTTLLWMSVWPLPESR